MRAYKKRHKGGIMEEISDMAALFATKVNPTGSPEISPVERLLNEFETHEAKEEESLKHYRKLLSKDAESCNEVSLAAHHLG
jgi:hypothetical protein